MTNTGKNPVKPGRVLVVGECLVDLAPAALPSSRPRHHSGGRERPLQQLAAMPGGSPANVAIGLARLEVPTSFGGRFSRLGFGPWLRSNLVANSVDMSFSVETDEPATLAAVTLDSDGRASYTFYGPGTADWQWQPHELVAPSGLDGVLAVHTGSLALALPPGAEVLSGWLRTVREHDRVVVSIDPNVRPGFVGDLDSYRQRLKGFLLNAHLVKVSVEDLAVLAAGQAPAEAAGTWLSCGAELVVITDGANGAAAFHRNGAQVQVSAPVVKVVDTIGAGDTFTAGFLAWLSDHDVLNPDALSTIGYDELRAALTQAVIASAFACSRAGADPPDRKELASFTRLVQ